MFPFTPPVAIHPLVGRERDLDAVRHLVSQGARWVTIVGPGGVGKTRLGTEVGRDVEQSLPGRVAFVPLAPVGDPRLVLVAIADAIGVSLSADEPVLDAIVTGLGDAPAMIVLDNVEHVAACRPDIRSLVQRCDALQIVATSRVALGASGETVVELEPLGVDDALELLAQVAGRDLPGFEGDERHLGALRSVCRRLDGLPLAIELAGSRLRVLSPGELAEALEEGFGVLRTIERVGTAHHRALSAAIEWSYRLLDDDGRRLLAALSVLAGSFGRDAAAAVSGLDRDRVLDGLDRLLAHHLLVTVDGDEASGRRFDMFESIREFAIAALEAGDEAPEVRARAERWASGLASSAAEQLTGPDQQQAVAGIDREIATVRAVLSWTITGRADTLGLRLVADLWRYWWMRGRLAEGREWCERVLDGYAGPENVELAHALRASGQLMLQIPRPTDARDLLERALGLFDRFGDEIGQAECWNTLGLFVHFDGDVARSESLHRAALEVYRRHGRQREVAVALNGLSAAAHLRGDFAAALQLGRETIDVLRRTGDARSVAVMLGVVAENTLMLADPTDAIPLYEEGLALAIDLADRWATGQALARLGRALVCAGRVERARGVLTEAEVVANEVGDDLAAAMSSLWRGRCAHLDRDLAGAGALTLDALRRSVAMDHADGIRATLRQLSVLAEAAGDVDAAVQLGSACSQRFAEPGTETFGVEGRFLPRSSDATAGIDAGEVARIRDAAAAWTTEQAVIAATGLVAGLPREMRPAVEHGVADRLGLTGREREVIGFLLQRRTDREIAAELGVSIRTVTTHVSAVLRKLDVRSRRDVAAEARRLGLVDGATGNT